MEVVRLVLSYKGVQWAEEAPADMKTDKVAYPFGQCPRYKDDSVDMVQSNAILRHLGRQYHMDGTTEQEKVLVDMALDLVESVRTKYVALIYNDKLSDEAKAAFVATHIAKDTVDSRNGGAHVSYLEWCVTRTDNGFLASGLTVGDFAVWDITDLLLRIWPDRIAADYPKLKAFHERVAALPNIAAYLSSDKRPAQPNGNQLG